MGDNLSLQWLEQAAGALLMLLVLLDVFLTVLYARAGYGIISRWVARLVWWLFKGVARPFGRLRGAALTFCGPAILVSLVLVWAFTLALGAGLIIHPKLGTSVRAESGETPTDFMTAVYAGGSSISVVGASNFSPHTGGFRLLYLFNSLVGMSVTSLTLTYLMQVYTALRSRNTLGLNLHLASAETGDAAELIARLGPEGKFDAGYSNLSELAKEMGQAKESHHFYPVLFYFRFQEPYYSVSRFTLVSLDAVTLIRSALDDGEYGWLKESGAAEHLWGGTNLLLETLTETFLHGAASSASEAPDADTRDLWRRRYFAALRRLRQAGIRTTEDEEGGAATYVNLRRRWDGYISAIAPMLAYSPEEVDPAVNSPESTDGREEFRARARSAGTP